MTTTAPDSALNGLGRAAAPQLPGLDNPQHLIDITAVLGTDYRGAFYMKNIQLGSKAMQAFVRRDFFYLSNMLRRTSDYRSIRGADGRKFDAFDKVLDDAFEAAKRLVSIHHEQLSVALTQNTVNPGELQFARPFTFRVPVVHPCARRYLDLLAAADEAYGLVDQAWIAEVVDYKEKDKRLKSIRKAFREIALQIRTNRFNALDYIWELRKSSDKETAAEIEGLARQDAADMANRPIDADDTATKPSAAAAMATVVGSIAASATTAGAAVEAAA